MITLNEYVLYLKFYFKLMEVSRWVGDLNSQGNMFIIVVMIVKH